MMKGAPERTGSGLERGVAILFMATGSVFAVIGSVSGSLELSALAGMGLPGVRGLFSSHQYMQVYGFLFEFVAGVSYVLIPRFHGRHMDGLPMIVLSYVAATAANVVFFVNGLELVRVRWLDAGSLLLVVASFAYLAQTLRSISWRSVVDCLIALSGVSLAASAVMIASSGSGGQFGQPLLMTVLLGFTGSTIFAVELKTASFRYSMPRPWASRAILWTQSAGVASAIASLWAGQVLLLSSVLFTCSALLAVFALRAERSALNQERRKMLGRRDLVRTRYYELCVRVALAWLVVGTFAGNGWAVWPTSFALKDTFIHATAIGFIGSTILGYGPILLPGLLSKKAPSRGLTLGPLLTLAIGVTIRMVGNALQAAQGIMPSWEAVSGYLVLIAMGWFGIMVHSLREEATA
jgi:hypothetical protein